MEFRCQKLFLLNSSILRRKLIIITNAGPFTTSIQKFQQMSDFYHFIRMGPTNVVSVVGRVERSDIMSELGLY